MEFEGHVLFLLFIRYTLSKVTHYLPMAIPTQLLYLLNLRRCARILCVLSTLALHRATILDSLQVINLCPCPYICIPPLSGVSDSTSQVAPTSAKQPGSLLLRCQPCTNSHRLAKLAFEDTKTGYQTGPNPSTTIPSSSLRRSSYTR